MRSVVFKAALSTWLWCRALHGASLLLLLPGARGRLPGVRACWPSLVIVRKLSCAAGTCFLGPLPFVLSAVLWTHAPAEAGRLTWFGGHLRPLPCIGALAFPRRPQMLHPKDLPQFLELLLMLFPPSVRPSFPWLGAWLLMWSIRWSFSWWFQGWVTLSRVVYWKVTEVLARLTPSTSRAALSQPRSTLG